MAAIAHLMYLPAPEPKTPIEVESGRTDAELVRLVQDELRWEEDLQGVAIRVSADQGRVSLTGFVPCHGMKASAQRAVQQVSGVVEIVNDIHVIPSPHPLADDSRTARAVCNALEADARLQLRSIQSSVQHGIVTLEGSVPTYHLSNCAEQVIEHLIGVQGIVNRLRVVPGAGHDAEIRLSIEKALAHQDPRYAHAINVAAHDGVVTLTGAVSTASEKDALLAAASHAPGIYAIEDHIQILLVR